MSQHTRTDTRYVTIQATTRASAINRPNFVSQIGLTLVKYGTTFMTFSITLQVFIEILKYTNSVTLYKFSTNTKQHQNKVIITLKREDRVTSTDNASVHAHSEHNENSPLRQLKALAYEYYEHVITYRGKYNRPITCWAGTGGWKVYATAKPILDPGARKGWITSRDNTNVSSNKTGSVRMR